MRSFKVSVRRFRVPMAGLAAFFFAGVIAVAAASETGDSPASRLPAPIRSNVSRPAVPPYRIGRPAHVLRDTTLLAPQFQGTLEKGVEYHAIIELESGAGGARNGRIEIALFPETAPNHVANFVSLARKGFYDGVTFHRVIPGFMAQGGDPTGTGGGGPGYMVNAEFSPTSHVRGTLSMARTPDPNSAGSQFFICFGPTPQLDGQYTVFGQVVSGMVYVDKLKPRDPRTNPPFRGDAMKRVSIIEIRRTPPSRRPVPPVTPPPAESRPATPPLPEVGRAPMSPTPVAAQERLELAWCAVPAMLATPAAAASPALGPSYLPAQRALGPVPAQPTLPAASATPGAPPMFYTPAVPALQPIPCSQAVRTS